MLLVSWDILGFSQETACRSEVGHTLVQQLLALLVHHRILWDFFQCIFDQLDPQFETGTLSELTETVLK